jgi:hypothetical protein
MMEGGKNVYVMRQKTFVDNSSSEVYSHQQFQTEPETRALTAAVSNTIRRRRRGSSPLGFLEEKSLLHHDEDEYWLLFTAEEDGSGVTTLRSSWGTSAP